MKSQLNCKDPVELLRSLDEPRIGLKGADGRPCVHCVAGGGGTGRQRRTAQPRTLTVPRSPAFASTHLKKRPAATLSQVLQHIVN